MSNQISPAQSMVKLSLLLWCFSALLIGGGCAVTTTTATKTENKSSSDKSGEQEKTSLVSSEAKNSFEKGRIKIAPDSPADAVRVFYKNLREKRFREAMMMTNLRPAVESLTDAEMEDLRPDFEPLAAQVPAEIKINGEIITNNLATVTANMPNEETGAPELKEIKLRFEKGVWVILTADEAAENAAKKASKNYFFALRLDIHHVEAQTMMERIAKAQIIYALQNGGLFADMQTLIEQNLLPNDAKNAASTGYRYAILLPAHKKTYSATAEPAVYGKTGKLSFLLEIDAKNQKTRLRSEDNKGAPLKNKKS